MLGNDFGPIPRRPLSWADVYAITGELHGVSIQEIESGRVDWEYDFTASNMRHCGRSGCKQVHGHGWVVALRGRRYVHVGNDCARKYVNASLWDAKVTVYKARVQSEARAEALILAREKAQSILWWLDNFIELLAAAKLFRSFQRGASGPLMADLQRRAEKRDFEVRHEIRLSADEVQRRRDGSSFVRPDGSTYTPHVPVTEFIRLGVLRGVGCFQKDITDLARSVESDAMFLLRTAHGAMEKQELDRTRSVMNRIGNSQRTLERVVSDISMFFSEANLALLLKCPVSRGQGVVAIEIAAGEVVVTRRPDWGKRAA